MVGDEGVDDRAVPIRVRFGRVQDLTEDHVRRLEFIALCRLLDLPLREIGRLLSSVHDDCCASARPGLRGLLREKLQEVDHRIALLKALRKRLESYFQRVPDGSEGQGTAGCTPATSPIECAFGDAPQKVEVEEPAHEATKRLTLQRLERVRSRTPSRGQRR